jgi:rod shape-determining protein MreC
MRRNWQNNRSATLSIALLACGVVIVLSTLGILAPLEDIATAPIRFMSRVFTQAMITINNTASELTEVEALRQRNAELERQIAIIQAELIELREIASDYNRLAGLLNYTRTREDFTTQLADVIGVEQQGLVRSLIISRGSRDGLRVGMPVVTELGLVGRIYAVSANIAQVQLITDQNSFVSARLQTSRAEGSVQGRGLLTGNLRMLYIPIDSEIKEGDLVVTSGLGGNFPPDVVVGQVTSKQRLEFELSQQAEVRSFIDFARLEEVLVVTNFQPADLSIFDPTGR